MNKKYDIGEELQKIQNLNRVITSYRRGSYELTQENNAFSDTINSYDKFYRKLKISLYNLCRKYPKDKEIKKFFNKVKKFYKEWEL